MYILHVIYQVHNRLISIINYSIFYYIIAHMHNNEIQSDTKFMHIVYIFSHQTTAKIHVKQQFGMLLCLQINSFELYIVKYHNSNS